MTKAEANKLKVGDVVQWGDDEGDTGVVVEAPRGAAGVKIRWVAYPEEGWLDKRDMASVSKVTGR